MVVLRLTAWCVLAVNATFGPAGVGKALWWALMRSVWTWGWFGPQF